MTHFPFTMNGKPAVASVHDPKLVAIAFASYGIALTIQFTIEEARAAIDALGKACEAAEQLAVTMTETAGTA